MEKCQFLNQPDFEHPFLIINKPSHLPSAPLKEGGESALTYAIDCFPQIKDVEGRKKVEYGLVHRIDTETSGLVLVALTQEAYDFFIEAQKNGKFVKYYRAKVQKKKNEIEGFPACPYEISEEKKSAVVSSSFRPFGPKGREVRPVSSESGKAAQKKGGETVYQTEIELKDEKNAVARIVAGYRHQVRCHLAWIGYPVAGDKIYNRDFRNVEEPTEMQFTAFRIEFPNPVTGVPEVFEI